MVADCRVCLITAALPRFASVRRSPTILVPSRRERIKNYLSRIDTDFASLVALDCVRNMQLAIGHQTFKNMVEFNGRGFLLSQKILNND